MLFLILFSLCAVSGTAGLMLLISQPKAALAAVFLWWLLLLAVSLCVKKRAARRWQKTLEAIDFSHPEALADNALTAPLAKKIDEFNRETALRLDAVRREHETQDEMRREFTANVSHELKTPLTSISGYAELLRDGVASPDDVKGFAEKICTESARLIALVGDILQLSKLDAGVKAAAEEIDLYALCRRVLSRLELPAEKKNVSLSLVGEPLPIRGDARLAEEIIYNLCDNAVKYNREGGSVCVTLRSCVDGAEVDVSDTGIGMAKEDLDHIFERFYRVDKSRSRSEGGTGLGLSIVKHATHCLGAAVTVESELGRGTTVRVLF